MTEKAFRYILTKHYPNIKFHEETNCDDIWVIPIGNWGVDRVLFSKSEKHARMWRTHSCDYHFSKNTIEFERWVEEQAEKGNKFEQN